MALIACPYCGGQVSTFAVKCPHCGKALQGAAPQPTPQPVIAQPTASSMPKWGGWLMVLFGIVSVILLIIQRIHNNDSSLSMDFHKAVFGFMMSFTALFFLLQTVRPSTAARQLISFLGFSFALFLMITTLMMWNGDFSDNSTLVWIAEKYSYFLLAFGLLLLLFAGTLTDWSRIVALASGVMWIVHCSYSYWNGEWRDAEEAMIALWAVAGILLLGMLIGWLIEASNTSHHPIYRLVAGLEILMIIGTIVVVAISMKDIFDNNYSEGYTHVKLSMIFILVAGSLSLLLSLFMKNHTLYVVSAIFVALSMFMLLGLYEEFYRQTHYMWYEDRQDTYRDLYYSSRFLLPISIMMVYVAEMTKGITGKISVKVQ